MLKIKTPLFRTISILIAVLMLATTNVYAAVGEWTTLRNGTDNTGEQTLSGNMASPSSTPLWSTHITGSLSSNLMETDANGDSYNDIILVEGGCVEAIDRNNSLIWKTDPINAYDIYGVYDLDNNGTKEILTFASKKLVVLSLSSGSTLWSLSLADNLDYTRFKVEDLDGDDKLEVIFYIYGQPYIYCYTFANGASSGSSKWTITDSRSEGDGNISAYAPEIAIADLEGDGEKEIGVAWYGGMYFFNALTGALDLASPAASGTNYSAASNGGTITVDSVYPGNNWPASYLIDGNANTYWINNRTVPGWAISTFSAWRDINYIKLYGLACLVDFTVETWNGSAWVVQETVTGNSVTEMTIHLDNTVNTNKVKVNITSALGNDGQLPITYQCQFSEIQCYKELPVSTANWAATANGGTITVDSVYPGGGYPASYLNDENVNSYWINNKTVPGWAAVTFSSTRNIRYVKLSGLGCERAFSVQTWDGSSWITQRSITNNISFSRFITFDSAVSTTKVRVYITDAVGNDGIPPITNHCHFSEIEAYEVLPAGFDFGLGATVVADSQYSATYPATKINDGNTASYWINNRTVPGWIYEDLLDQQYIQYVDMYGMASSKDFSIQTWNGSSWDTQKTISENSRGTVAVKFDSPVLTSRVKVNITESTANDGQQPITYQSQFSELQVRTDPNPRDFTTTYHKADWIAGPGANGRNYGLLKLIDIDFDNVKEGIIVADGVCRHIGVVDNALHGTQLLYDRFVEFPIINKTMRVVCDDVCDINGDGYVEIVYGVYDTTTSNWTLYIMDALTNTDIQTISGLYLWGIEDVNNDGKKELLVSEENTATPKETSTIAVYGLSGGSYQSIWSKSNSSFVIESGTSTTNDIGDGSYAQRKKPLMVDTDGNGVYEFFINDAGTYKAIDCTDGTTEWSTTVGVPLKVLSMFNNDENQILTCDSDGKMKLVGENQTVLWTRDAGSSIMAVTPVTADIDNDGSMEMVVSDGIKTRVYRITGNGATLLWTDTGKGATFYSNGNSSAVVENIYGDSRKEIIVKDVNAQGVPIIKVLDCSGNTCWSYAFSGFGSNSIYQWMPGDFNGDGVKDIYVGLLENGIDTGRARIINGNTQTLLWASADTYNVGSGIYRSPGPYPGIPAVKDIDGDGGAELVFVALDTYFRFDWNGSTMVESHVLSGDTDIYYSSMVLTDIDNNGSIENVVAAGFNRWSVYNNNMSSQLWVGSAGGNYDIMRRMQGIGDVDNDGIKEIGVQFQLGAPANMFYSYTATNGTCEWGYDLSTNYGSNVVANDIQVCDIDGDGRKEYILTTNTGYLIALNGEIGATPRVCWSINLGVALGNVIVTDIDDDDQSEIVVFAGDGKIYAFN